MTTKRTELYYPDGRVLVREWEPGTRPAYEWLSKAVEGYIEVVDRFLDGGPEGRVQAYANEEGRLRDMPGNVPGMKALNWPEPPGGWSAFDPDNLGAIPSPVIITSPNDPQLAELSRRWDPVVGPVLILWGWSEAEYDDEKGLNPDELGELKEGTN